MIEFVGALLLFTAVAFGFVFVNMLAGSFVRPSKMDAEKATIYECGEPAIGSAWVQFDLRFYVVALLFVIFDVEMAFFFPWAVVFGDALKHLDSAGLDMVSRDGYQTLAWLAFYDVLFFFGVLLVGFAYLWKRGDLDWVRSVVAQQGDLPRDLIPLTVLTAGPTPSAVPAAAAKS